MSQSQAEIERFFIELVQLGVSTIKLAELFPIDLSKFERALIESIELQEKLFQMKFSGIKRCHV
ncbi:MAG: penicillin amidase [Oleiphilaceae bacterium]